MNGCETGDEKTTAECVLAPPDQPGFALAGMDQGGMLELWRVTAILGGWPLLLLFTPTKVFSFGSAVSPLP